MATKERLEQALRNADAAGDIDAAKAFANAIRNGNYDGAQEPATSDKSVLQSINEAIANNPIGATVAEGAAAFNRGVTKIADIPIEAINAGMQLAGSEKRIPTITSALSPATTGNFMDTGLGRDVVRAAGEAVPAAIGIGSMLRGAAEQLPSMASGAESVGSGVLRQMGKSTAIQDATSGALSGAGQAIGNEYGGTTGAIIGSVAAPLAPSILKSAGESVLKSLFSNADNVIANKTIDDFASFNSFPTVGMASGKKSLQGAENVSGKTWSGSPLASASDEIAANMQNKLKLISSNISNKEGAEQAGLAIQKGISGKDGFVDKFKQNSSVLWNKTDDLINKDIPVSLDNTKSTLDRLVQGGSFGDILDNPKIAQIKNVIDSNESIDYETLRKLRSLVGAKIAGSDLVSDIPKAELKQLYGALTQDTKQVAAQSGSDAISAFNRANTYTRAGHERIDDYLQRLSDKVNPDEVFNALSKGGEGTKLLNTVKKSVSPNDWNILSSNVIRRLGRASSGNQNAIGDDAIGDAFSVQKFVTDWDKLGPARKAIFSGSEKLDKYADNLNKIARAASVVKEAGLPSANASGSAQAASRYAAGSAAVGSAVTMNPTPILIAAGSVAMNNAGARLMTNPRFVALLANQGNKPLSKAFIGSLAGLAKESSAQEAADIYELTKEFESKLEEQK